MHENSSECAAVASSESSPTHQRRRREGKNENENENPLNQISLHAHTHDSESSILRVTKMAAVSICHPSSYTDDTLPLSGGAVIKNNHAKWEIVDTQQTF
jgi:hypothetical protein